ncbi:MAG: hypothetical protein QXF26_05490 [Candidatus Bathyarchaeia archaeon]
MDEETIEMITRIDADIKRITFLAKRLRSKRVFTHSYSSTVAETLRGSKLRVLSLRRKARSARLRS